MTSIPPTPIEPVLTPQEKADKKRQYMRDYMREYKAKKYSQNAEYAEAVRRENRTRYIKKTKEVDTDALKKYGSHLADILMLKRIIARIPSQLISEVITPLAV